MCDLCFQRHTTDTGSGLLLDFSWRKERNTEICQLIHFHFLTKSDANIQPNPYQRVHVKFLRSENGGFFGGGVGWLYISLLKCS